MISPFPHHNLEKILIPIHFWPPPVYTKASFLLLLLIITQSLSFSFSYSYSLSNIENNKIKKPVNNNNSSNKETTTMKVHPIPKKRNITVQYERNPQGGLAIGGGGSHKKLRRLPHIFSRVLELPFRSDADVAVEENPECFRFTAETDNNIGDVRAHMIEIHPGVTKIVVRPNGFLELSSLDQLELDMWRFRLPESTRPELASAVFVDGELIVTVPKGEGVEEGGGGEEEEVWGDGANGGGFRGGMGNNNRLVLVQ